jgi:hypothetical protein
MIRAFIPGLYDQDTQSPFLSQEDQTIFYELGFLPAVQELCDDRSAEWPSRYSDEMFRARCRNGTLTFQSKMIPYWNVRQLGETIRSKLRHAGVPWATGITFLHQIRGVKDATYHGMDPRSAEEALDEFFIQNNLDLNEVESTGDWWIDVGVQVSSGDKCLAWRTDSHGRIVWEICKIPLKHAQRLTSIGSSQYVRDIVSHLPQVSGCRIQPGVQGQGPYEVSYLQLYLTDKAVTYHPEKGHHGKFTTCNDVVNGKANKYLEGLYSLYLNAIEGNYAQARMEVRIPIQFATETLMNLRSDVICGGLVSFPCVEWWYALSIKAPFISLTASKYRSLRAYRAKAVQLVLAWQAEAPWQHRATKSALLLIAGCVWLLNGLHSTPDNGPSSRDLMDCILPEVDCRGAEQMFLAYGKAVDADDDDFIDGDFDDLEKLPGNPYGLVFFRSLRVGPTYPVPKLKSTKGLSGNSFRNLFGIEFADIDESFFRSGHSVRHGEAPLRSKNRGRRTKRYVLPDDAPPENLFHLGVRGVEIELPPDLDEDSDLDDEGSEVEGLRLVGGDVDQRLTRLWLQFIYDITQMVPNRKGAHQQGYCKLSAEERKTGGERLYKNLRLSDFFNDCQWRLGNKEDWDMAFNHLFPLSDQPGKKQNYKQGSYYKEWKEVRDGAADEEALQTIRRALKSKFNGLLWFPCPQGDRIWATRLYVSLFKKFVDFDLPAPWVICRREPSW